MNKQNRFNTGILLIIGAILFNSGSILAQQQQDRNQPPKPPSTTEVNKMVDDLSVKLSLDKTQKQKVSELFSAHFNKLRESMGNKQGKGSQEEMQQKRKDFEKQVKNLLNDEQKAEFDKFMQSRGPQPNQQPKR
jgi:hypothetical protein